MVEVNASTENGQLESNYEFFEDDDEILKFLNSITTCKNSASENSNYLNVKDFEQSTSQTNSSATDGDLKTFKKQKMSNSATPPPTPDVPAGKDTAQTPPQPAPEKPADAASTSTKKEETKPSLPDKTPTERENEERTSKDNAEKKRKADADAAELAALRNEKKQREEADQAKAKKENDDYIAKNATIAKRMAEIYEKQQNPIMAQMVTASASHINQKTVFDSLSFQFKEMMAQEEKIAALKQEADEQRQKAENSSKKSSSNNSAGNTNAPPKKTSAKKSIADQSMSEFFDSIAAGIEQEKVNSKNGKPSDNNAFPNQKTVDSNEEGIKDADANADIKLPGNSNAKKDFENAYFDRVYENCSAETKKRGIQKHMEAAVLFPKALNQVKPVLWNELMKIHKEQNGAFQQ